MWDLWPRDCELSVEYIWNSTLICAPFESWGKFNLFVWTILFLQKDIRYYKKCDTISQSRTHSTLYFTVCSRRDAWQQEILDNILSMMHLQCHLSVLLALSSLTNRIYSKRRYWKYFYFEWMALTCIAFFWVHQQIQSKWINLWELWYYIYQFSFKHINFHVILFTSILKQILPLLSQLWPLSLEKGCKLISRHKARPPGIHCLMIWFVKALCSAASLQEALNEILPKPTLLHSCSSSYKGTYTF